jgi:hypothetical protein
MPRSVAVKLTPSPRRPQRTREFSQILLGGRRLVARQCPRLEVEPNASSLRYCASARAGYVSRRRDGAGVFAKPLKSASCRRRAINASCTERSANKPRGERGQSRCGVLICARRSYRGDQRCRPPESAYWDSLTKAQAQYIDSVRRDRAGLVLLQLRTIGLGLTDEVLNRTMHRRGLDRLVEYAVPEVHGASNEIQHPYENPSRLEGGSHLGGVLQA